MPYNPDNIFARILRKELPCHSVFEDEHTLCFMDIMPQSEGHCLVISKEPAETLLELSEAGALACMKTLQRIATAVQQAFDCPGLMVMQLNGAEAGQTVPHLHFHIIPRRATQTLKGHGSKMADPQVLAANAAKIRAALNPS